MPLRVLTWNIFHGRDHPPDPALLTWRSRLLRVSERNGEHIQVNRDLAREFAGLLAGAAWDVAILQECPPRWHARLAAACGAEAHGVLTSRNSLAPLRRLATRFNPDLIASNEGGSNLTLVRGAIAERRALELRAGPAPERRVMAFTRTVPAPGEAEVCVANLHLSSGEANRRLAEQEARLAADRARVWAAGAPLVLGGDFNLRPASSSVFAELEARHGLRAPTAATAIDHILGRELPVVEPARRWEPSGRELAVDGLRLRLSDHAPVEAVFTLDGPAAARE